MSFSICHVNNALKIRIMLAIFRDEDGTMTCKELANQLHVPRTNISSAMVNYRSKQCGYFRRLKPDKGTKAYKYRLTKKGRMYLLKYAKKVYYGYGLNLDTHKVTRMPRFEMMQRKRHEEYLARQAEFERTGIQPPAKPKETWRDWIKITDADLVDYIRLTKYGALEMSLTRDYIVQEIAC